VSGDKDLTSLATVSPPVLSAAAFLDLPVSTGERNGVI
jgi:hypothetical protein